MSPDDPPALTHASAVAAPVDGAEERWAGVLIRGPSGAGKSTLALRLIALGAQLVADDVVALTPRNGGVALSAPERLRGRIEARGVGVLSLPARVSAPLAWVVDLAPAAAPARIPQRQFVDFFKFTFPVIFITESDRAASILYSLARSAGAIRDPSEF